MKEPHTPTRPLIAAIARREFERVGPLLEEGADANASGLDGDKETALMLAAGMGQRELVDQLLAAGADASARDVWGRTACIWAAEAHFDRLAEQLWQAQTAKAPSELTGQDLHATQMDDIQTPLTNPDAYLALRALCIDRHPARLVRFMALAAEAGRTAALQRISDDNNRMVRTGPYLLCRRMRLPDEAIRRPTNPLARSLGAYELKPSNLLVLAHLPTATTSPGRSISRQSEPWYCGWASITAVFAEHAEVQARNAAIAEPGRVSLVKLTDVCTCYEGWVESHEALVNAAGALQVTGQSKTLEPDTGKQPGQRPRSPRAASAIAPDVEVQPLRPVRTGAQRDFYIKRGIDLFLRFPSGFLGFSLLSTGLTAACAVSMSRLPPWLGAAGVAALWGLLSAGLLSATLGLAAGRTFRFAEFLRGYRFGVPAVSLFLLAWGFGVATVFMPLFGIVAAYAGISSMYALALVVDRELGLLAALAESWRMTHRSFIDSAMQFTVIVLAAMAGVALFGVGVLFSIPWAACILTTAYKDQ